MKYSPFDKPVKDDRKKINPTKDDEDSEITYDKLKKKYLKQFETPKELKPLPEAKDYENGVFTRYFIRKRNNPAARILEIDKRQYKRMSFTKSGIDKNLYVEMELEWKLTGPKNDILSQKNSIKVYGIQDTNYRTLLFKDKEMEGILQKLSNTLEYAKISE